MKPEDRLLWCGLTVAFMCHGASAIRHGIPSEALAALAFTCVALGAVLLPHRECAQCSAPTRTPDSMFCEQHSWKPKCQQCGVVQVWVPMPEHAAGGLWCWDLTVAPQNRPPLTIIRAVEDEAICPRCDPE